MASLVAGITTGGSVTECAQAIVQEEKHGAIVIPGVERVGAANATKAKHSKCKLLILLMTQTRNLKL